MMLYGDLQWSKKKTWKKLNTYPIAVNSLPLLLNKHVSWTDSGSKKMFQKK